MALILLRLFPHVLWKGYIVNSDFILYLGVLFRVAASKCASFVQETWKSKFFDIFPLLMKKDYYILKNVDVKVLNLKTAKYSAHR